MYITATTNTTAVAAAVADDIAIAVAACKELHGASPRNLNPGVQGPAVVYPSQ